MNHSGVVDRLESAKEVGHEGDGVGNAELLLDGEKLTEVLAAYEFEDDLVDVFVLPGAFIGHDVGVLDVHHGLGFSEEATKTGLVIEDVGTDDLHGGGATSFEVSGGEHGAHSARSETLDQAVTADLNFDAGTLKE